MTWLDWQASGDRAQDRADDCGRCEAPRNRLGEASAAQREALCLLEDQEWAACALAACSADCHDCATVSKAAGRSRCMEGQRIVHGSSITAAGAFSRQIRGKLARARGTIAGASLAFAAV